MKGGGIKSRCCGNSEVVRLGDVAARRGSRREGEGQMGRLFTHQRSAEGRARRRQGGESPFAGAFASGVLKLVAYRPAPERPTMGCRFGPKYVGPKIRTDVVSCCFREREKRVRRRNKDDVRLNMGQHLAQMLLHCVSSREATGAEKGAIHSAQTCASCASSKRVVSPKPIRRVWQKQGTHSVQERASCLLGREARLSRGVRVVLREECVLAPRTALLARRPFSLNAGAAQAGAVPQSDCLRHQSSSTHGDVPRRVKESPATHVCRTLNGEADGT